MSISRRNLLRTLGAGTVANVAIPSLASGFSNIVQTARARRPDAPVRLDARLTADVKEEFYNHANVRMLGVSDSQTNFVLLQVDHPAEEILEHFRKNNVLLGWPIPGWNDFVRVSMGRPADMKEFWRVWDLLPHQMPQH